MHAVKVYAIVHFPVHLHCIIPLTPSPHMLHWDAQQSGPHGLDTGLP